MLPVWYRARIDCDTIGTDWSSVRANITARAIADYVAAGIAQCTYCPALFDPRYFPYQFSEKQSTLATSNLRSLLKWAVGKWPDWSLGAFTLWPVVTWLETLNEQDQKKTLEILGEHYGCGFE